MLALVACGGPSSWEDITDLDTGSDKIRAGTAVRIEPSAFEAAEISSTEFSIKKFNFSGTRKDGSGGLELLPTVTLMASEGDFHSVETQSQEAIQWTVGEAQKAITISFLNMPTGSAYSGKGSLYFYMTDKDKNCVSNIVAWPVAFKE